MRAQVEQGTVLVGNRAFLSESGVEVDVPDDDADTGERARTRVLVAVDGQALGAIAIDDPIKPGAADAVGTLQAGGLEVRLLSGDSQAAAERGSEQPIGAAILA